MRSVGAVAYRCRVSDLSISCRSGTHSLAHKFLRKVHLAPSPMQVSAPQRSRAASLFRIATRHALVLTLGKGGSRQLMQPLTLGAARVSSFGSNSRTITWHYCVYIFNSITLEIPRPVIMFQWIISNHRVSQGVRGVEFDASNNCKLIILMIQNSVTVFFFFEIVDQTSYKISCETNGPS